MLFPSWFVNRSLRATLKFQGSELKKNVLPLKRNVLLHYQYLKCRLKETGANFRRKDVEFKDVKGWFTDNVAKVWISATLPILSHIRIETKFKELLEMWKMSLPEKRR